MQNAPLTLDAFEKDMVMRGFLKKTVHKYVEVVRIYLNECCESGMFSLDMIYSDAKPSLAKMTSYCDEHDHTFKTKQNYFSAISAYYSFLIEEDIVRIDPVPQYRQRYLRTYKEKPQERQIVSAKKTKQIIKNIQADGYKTAALFLAKAGLRREECCRIDVGCFYFEQNLLVLKDSNDVRKRSNRRIPLDDEMTTAIKSHWKRREAKGETITPTSPAFVGPKGGRINGESMRKQIERAAELAGVHRTDRDAPLCEKFTPHCFRHWMTTTLIENGMCESLVEEIRGDNRRRRKSFELYNHISNERLVSEFRKYSPHLFGRRFWEKEI